MTIDTMFTGAAARPRKSWPVTLESAWSAFHRWRVKRRTRRFLLEITDDQLRDIGITRSDARREVRKSFYWM